MLRSKGIVDRYKDGGVADCTQAIHRDLEVGLAVINRYVDPSVYREAALCFFTDGIEMDGPGAKLEFGFSREVLVTSFCLAWC